MDELEQAIERLLEWAEGRTTWAERLTWLYPVKDALAAALAEREREEEEKELTEEKEKHLAEQVAKRQAEQVERRKRLVEKMRLGRDRMRQQTGRCEGRKPYGSDPHEAAILDAILAEHRKGKAYNAIARELNTANRLTRSGKLWDAGTVRKLCLRSGSPKGPTVVSPQ
jgi:hypothetical protein